MEFNEFINSVLPVMTEEQKEQVLKQVESNPFDTIAEAINDPIEKALYASYEANKNAIGVYQNDTLCLVEAGTFAANVFLKNGNVNEVAGTRMNGWTADDCKLWNLGKSNVRHATYEDIKRLMPKACPKFVKWFMNGLKFKDEYKDYPDF